MVSPGFTLLDPSLSDLTTLKLFTGMVTVLLRQLLAGFTMVQFPVNVTRFTMELVAVALTDALKLTVAGEPPARPAPMVKVNVVVAGLYDALQVGVVLAVSKPQEAEPDTKV